MDIQTAKEVIKAAALADDTVLMEGLHGIGKSNIVKQFAIENGYHIEELFLSHQEVGDIIGVPGVSELNGVKVTVWSIPIWMQRMRESAEKGVPSILFLDELNRAQIDVRQSALQLVLDRKIHEHELPVVNGRRTMVVAAINPADDYQVDELDPALLDRFLYIKVEADHKSWLEWARKKNVNQVVRDFITEFPDRIHFTPADGSIGATPRSWSKLGDFMDNIDSVPEEILFQIIKGKVGVEIGAQFYSFYQNYSNIIKMEDIEKIVIDNYESVSDIHQLASLIYDKIQDAEAIHKLELTHQLAKKYMMKNDILPFLSYLYALDIEICVSFLKSYKNDEPELYSKLALIDTELNNMELFKRVVDASDNIN